MAAKKRTSGAGSSGTRTPKRGKQADAPGTPSTTAPSTPAIGNEPAWWSDAMDAIDKIFDEHTSMEQYLTSRYPSVQARKAFATELIQKFPPADDIEYIKNFLPGTKIAHVAQLSFHAQAGNKGLVVVEQAKNLVRLVLKNGFQTDPYTPGVEAIVLCELNPALFPNPKDVATGPVMPNAPDALGHQACGMVKGWTRCGAALTACTILIDLGATEEVAGFNKVHGLVACYSDETARIDANRG